ncbi:YqeG family HAD IIIA-type phosphatase [Candidatus Phytoplasma meliae]|uniref:YqeG family HAD IIIA-type phosphatase n=1 Tax=Candidatus Phytoplasma meliae TaxID=1848402 RepID=A0ABS5CYV2_9MOLU|nr:YqeG family HAD IIIA-type phosphatase [Candidatus Phytoplasma meliae]MBP5836153.1 YqeG family HAD IIIA-type phosphatase [Candidatus Phytoplasma meliae]MBP5836256.1 YqeG family HAD IIIA-type phosphatase [Candidatus Phytoplasma meliae]
MWSNNNLLKSLYLPKYYYPSVFHIPFDYFLQKGIKALFFDLDNTLVDGQQKELDMKTKKLLQQLSVSFKIMILSNASYKRLQHALTKDFHFIHLPLWMKKPSKQAFQKAMHIVDLKPEAILMIGDQLHTDINGANRSNITSLLVKPLNLKQESIWTKFNRFYREKRFLKKLKVNHYHLWQTKFQDFEGK